MASISKTNEQLVAKSEALKKITEHNRDYLSLTLTLPLGNKELKNVHTNQWLFTDLPKEFDLANWTILADALNSSTSRFEKYIKNRWYIEGVDITVEADGKAEMKLTLNAFASSITSYTQAAKEVQKAHTQAVENEKKATETASKNTSNAVKKTTSTAKTAAKVDINKALDEVGKLMAKKKYARGTYTKYSQIKKYGKGDCWAGSYFVACELKKRGVTCRIMQYKTSMSDRHRSVQYKNSKGNWVDFPYKKYGISTNFRNTSNASKGKQIKIDCS